TLGRRRAHPGLAVFQLGAPPVTREGVMRKASMTLGVTLLLLSGAACSSNPTTPPNTPSGNSPSALNCTTSSLHLLKPGTLTVATDNPAFNPWFAGTKSAHGSPWKADPNNGTGDPYSGQGYESEVAYDIASQLGLTKAQVKWVVVPFNNSYKPGSKNFDFYIGQVSYSPVRAQAVDFSEGYFDVQQALVANKSTPITPVKTFAD